MGSDHRSSSRVHDPLVLIGRFIFRWVKVKHELPLVMYLDLYHYMIDEDGLGEKSRGC